jgi:hypothetical protein
MGKKSKKIIAFIIMVLMIVATISSSVFAADSSDEYTNLKWNNLARLSFTNTDGNVENGYYIVSFWFDGSSSKYEAFCLDVLEDASKTKNYEAESLESYLTNSTVSEKVREITSESIINKSVSDILADLNVSATGLGQITYQGTSYQWSDLSEDEQQQVCYAAAQAAIWATIGESVSGGTIDTSEDPTFSFFSTSGWTAKVQNNAALTLYNAYMQLSGVSDLTSGNVTITTPTSATVGPTFPATYTFSVTVSGDYTGTPTVTADGYTIIRTDTTASDTVVEYSMYIDAAPSSPITIQVSVTGVKEDVVALECTSNSDSRTYQELAAMGDETYTESESFTLTASGYTIDTSVINGTISENATVLQGESTTVTYSANDHYHLVSVILDEGTTSEQDVTDTNPTSYTFSNVTANHTISVVYAIDTYTLTYTTDGNGTIEGTAQQTVAYGKDGTEVTAVANTGYHFVSWSDGVTTATRTDLDITSDLSVQANFEIDAFTVTFVNYNGTVLKTETVDYGNDATAPANPSRTGYRFTGWDTDYTNITSDLTVTAQYTINAYPYTVNYEDASGNALATSVTNSANYDTSVTEDALAIDGYTVRTDAQTITIATAGNVITFIYDATAVPTEEITDEETPLASDASGTSWALLNLIMMIASFIFAGSLVITYFKTKKEEEQKEVKRKLGWRIASIVIAIASLITFILNEDMTAPIVFTDSWTILMIAYAVLEIGTMILSKKKKEEKEQV